MQKLAAGGYFVTIAGALAPQPKPGVKQASFINSDTNLASAPLLESLTDIANNGTPIDRSRLFHRHKPLCLTAELCLPSRSTADATPLCNIWSGQSI